MLIVPGEPIVEHLDVASVVELAASLEEKLVRQQSTPAAEDCVCF